MMRASTLLLPLLLLVSCQPKQDLESPEPRWYRGNLHTHTLWSDGDDFPDMVVDWYRSEGYNFLALSDHNVLSTGERWLNVDEALRPAYLQYVSRFGGHGIDTLRVVDTTRVRLKTFEELRGAFEAPGKFVLIQAEEITESVDRHPVHVNATNIIEFVPPQGGSTVAEVLQRNIDAVLAQREQTQQIMFPHINHPNYGWGISLEDLLAVDGEEFFEIYNGHPLVHNLGDDDHPAVEQMWDVILSARFSTGREPMYGLAVDDAHHYHGVDLALANPGRGWIMVNADTLTPNAILEAMESGRFYASTGVSLRDIKRQSDGLDVEIDPEQNVEYVTEFIGSTVDSETGKTAIGITLSSTEGTHPSYRFRGDELYVRARVVSSKVKYNPNRPDETEVAWTQPIVASKVR